MSSLNNGLVQCPSYLTPNCEFFGLSTPSSKVLLIRRIPCQEAQSYNFPVLQECQGLSILLTHWLLGPSFVWVLDIQATLVWIWQRFQGGSLTVSLGFLRTLWIFNIIQVNSVHFVFIFNYLPLASVSSTSNSASPRFNYQYHCQ